MSVTHPCQKLLLDDVRLEKHNLIASSRVDIDDSKACIALFMNEQLDCYK